MVAGPTTTPEATRTAVPMIPKTSVTNRAAAQRWSRTMGVPARWTMSRVCPFG